MKYVRSARLNGKINEYIKYCFAINNLLSWQK